MHHIITVLGGDMRMRHAAEYLAENAHKVHTFFKVDDLVNKNLETALSESDVLLLPLPCEKGKYIFSDSEDFKISSYALFDMLKSDCLVLGGKLSESFLNMAELKEIHVIDYYEREELAVMNASLTAEAAVFKIMNYSPLSMSDSNILICGFGRIGKHLAKILSPFGNVTVSARKASDKAWIQSLGLNYVCSYSLRDCIKSFDVIVNTVPNLLLTKEVLKNTKPGATVIDLASRPGGCDFEYAQSAGINIYQELSLPGRIFPESAGIAVAKSILNILCDLGA